MSEKKFKRRFSWLFLLYPIVLITIGFIYHAVSAGEKEPHYSTDGSGNRSLREVTRESVPSSVTGSGKILNRVTRIGRMNQSGDFVSDYDGGGDPTDPWLEDQPENPGDYAN